MNATLSPSKPASATMWADVSARYFRGMRNPDLTAHAASFGGLQLMVVHDVNGWSCRSPMFVLSPLPRARTEEQAKSQAIELLRAWLMLALAEVDGR